MKRTVLMLVFALIIGTFSGYVAGFRSRDSSQHALSIEEKRTILNSAESFGRKVKSYLNRHEGLQRVLRSDLLRYVAENDVSLLPIFGSVDFEIAVSSSASVLGVFDTRGCILCEDDLTRPGLERNYIDRPSEPVLNPWIRRRCGDESR